MGKGRRYLHVGVVRAVGVLKGGVVSLHVGGGGGDGAGVGDGEGGEVADVLFTTNRKRIACQYSHLLLPLNYPAAI